ncbi:glycosyltransferase [Methanocorpusculum sp. MG]|uniref:Glycosyltransferase n=1 Tax=Methanocorpusculum petauri TaxID=3002863 RepID=A0ABT4IHL6_9EURY|nr:glycosyltransferase family 2 protein [Methanocorpusculum petauri]MCZ0861238.1 glycosyltransferase [Methanocorpusculum petauri]
MISAAATLLIVCGIGIGCVAAYPYFLYLRKIHGISFTASPKLATYPSVSIVVNAYQEGDLVRTRIEDIFHAAYPSDKITLYVVNDGADPATGDAAKKALKDSLMKSAVIEPKERIGKIKCQNMVISMITDEIIVFTDADITTEPDALAKLISRLQDPEIGAVCADLIPVGSSQNVTGSEGAYRSVYGKMCEYDSQLDATYNFNGPLIAFKKSAVPHIEETIGADDANLALTCIANGYRAIYAADAVAYELQPVSFRAQYRQKVRRADGLVNSTRLFGSACHEKRAVFWKHIFPRRRWMLLYSPVLFVVSAVLLLAGCFLWSLVYGTILILIGVVGLIFSIAKPDNLLSSFVLNQIYLIIGLAKRKNIQMWDRVEK